MELIKVIPILIASFFLGLSKVKTTSVLKELTACVIVVLLRVNFPLITDVVISTFHNS
jgi:hypothetical protein